MVALGDLPGARGSVAYGINNDGDVVGQENGAVSGINHALLWEDGSVYDLNDLLDASGAGWTLVNAFDINDSGQIVGYGFDPSGQTRAFLLNEIPEPTPRSLVAAALIGIAASRRRRIPWLSNS